MSSSPERVFVHGWGTDKRVWRGLLDDSSLAMDLPGHGAKETWDEPTLAPALSLLSVRLAGRAEPIGIGWSLGAQLLMAVAMEGTVRFRALVLVGATPSFVAREGFPWGQKRALVRRMILDMKRDPAGTLRRFYRLNFTGDELESGRAREFLTLYDETPPGFCFDGITTALKTLMDMDLRDGLGSIDVPTLIIHGSRDGVCPVGAAHYLAENIKGAELMEFTEAGHAPFVTEPERFDRVVKEFMKT